MRILTDSSTDKKGLISIVEADENLPQFVVFAIPIEINEADRIIDIFDFKNYFSRGISTKIIDRGNVEIIHLKLISPTQNFPERHPTLKFVATVKGHEINFYLSPLNFLNDDFFFLDIDFYYSGKYLNEELNNKKLVILEPDWKQLDTLFFKHGIIFIDWKS